MKKWFTLIFSSLMVTLIAANHPNSNMAASEKSSTATNAADQDAELSKKINDKLAPGFFSKGWEGVTAKVNKGVVTLQGNVKTKEDKEKLEKRIRDIKGVKDVKSDLKVQETSHKY